MTAEEWTAVRLPTTSLIKLRLTASDLGVTLPALLDWFAVVAVPDLLASREATNSLRLFVQSDWGYRRRYAPKMRDRGQLVRVKRTALQAFRDTAWYVGGHHRDVLTWLMTSKLCEAHPGWVKPPWRR